MEDALFVKTGDATGKFCFWLLDITSLAKIKNKMLRSETRLVFSRFLDLHGNLGIVKEKPTRKTCFSLAPRIY